MKRYFVIFSLLFSTYAYAQQWTSVPSSSNIYNTQLSGFVGIGTATPGNNLTVYSNNNPSIRITGNYNTTSNAHLSLGVSNCNGCYSAIALPGDAVIAAFTQQSKNLILSTQSGLGGAIKFSTGEAGSDLERMTILSNGYVGINVPNPTQRLELNGAMLIRSNQTGGGVNRFLINMGWQQNQNTFSISPQTSDGLGWNFNRDFILDQSGLMTKRVDNAQKAFNIVRWDLGQDVFRVMGDGKVYATELNIKLSSQFPDYVFAKNYPLMPLSNLEQYINTNSKLPNIPSANDVANSGLNVGELQTLQMEKIEELTLYIIELNKRILELEKEIKAVK